MIRSAAWRGPLTGGRALAALAVGLARGVDPQLGVESRRVRLRGGPLAEAAARRVATITRTAPAAARVMRRASPYGSPPVSQVALGMAARRLASAVPTWAVLLSGSTQSRACGMRTLRVGRRGRDRQERECEDDGSHRVVKASHAPWFLAHAHGNSTPPPPTMSTGRSIAAAMHSAAAATSVDRWSQPGRLAKLAAARWDSRAVKGDGL